MTSDDIITKKFEEFLKADKKGVQTSLDSFEQPKKEAVKPAVAKPAVAPKEEVKPPMAAPAERQPVAAVPPKVEAVAPKEVQPAQGLVDNSVKSPESAKMTDDEKIALMAMRDGKLDYNLFMKLKADFEREQKTGEDTFQRIFEKVEDIPNEELGAMFENGALREDKLEAYRKAKEEAKAESLKRNAAKMLEHMGGKEAYNKVNQFTKPGFTNAVGIANSIVKSGIELGDSPRTMVFTDDKGQSVEADVRVNKSGNLVVTMSHLTRVTNKPKYTTKSTITIPIKNTAQGKVINTDLINNNIKYWYNNILWTQNFDEKYMAEPTYVRIIDTIINNVKGFEAGKIPKFEISR